MPQDQIIREQADLARYAMSVGMSASHLISQVTSIKAQMQKLKSDNRNLERVLDNRNSQRLARRFELGYATEPLPDGEKKKLQSKLRAVESKIAMTRRMLADLEDAEEAFPGQEVQIGVKRFHLKAELSDMVKMQQKAWADLNPKTVSRKVDHRATTVSFQS